MAEAEGLKIEMITIRQMQIVEIDSIAEIDRSERVTLSYEVEDGALRPVEVDWDVPRWFLEGQGDHTVWGNIQAWRPYLEQGGVMYGAFDGALLVGFAIFRPYLAKDMAQLAVLHVSRRYRRQGIATRLTGLAVQRAMETGAMELYVSATPSESAVGFYLSQGFRLADQVHPELHELEPEDIHMVRTL